MANAVGVNLFSVYSLKYLKKKRRVTDCKWFVQYRSKVSLFYNLTNFLVVFIYIFYTSVK